MVIYLNPLWRVVCSLRFFLSFTEYFRDPSSQQSDGLETVLRRLQTDKDRDVRQNAILKQYTNPLQLI